MLIHERVEVKRKLQDAFKRCKIKTKRRAMEEKGTTEKTVLSSGI